MKKLYASIILFFGIFNLYSMEWSEYEMICYANGIEPTYEDYRYLCEEGATDYGYDEEDILKLFENVEDDYTEDEIIEE